MEIASSDTDAGGGRRHKRKMSSDTESDLTATDTSEFKVPRKASRRKRKEKPRSSPAPETPKAPAVPAPAPAASNEPITAKEDPTVTIFRTKAEKLYRSLVGTITDPSNGIPAGVIHDLIEKSTRLQGMLTQSLIYCSKLEGCLESAKEENKDQRRTFQAAQEKIATAAPANTQRPLTYAERVGVRSKIAAASTRKQDPANVVTILPEDLSRFGTSDQTKEAVQALISPSTDGLQIKNVRRIQGAGIVVETAKKSDVALLLANQKLRAAGLVVGAPAKKSPRVIIYDVPRFEKDSAIMETIAEQNMDTAEANKCKSQAKLAFKSGDKTRDRCNCIFEVSKEVRDLLIKKEKLYIGWSCCRVQDFVSVTRCYKCHGYGHAAKYCKAEKEICGHCAESGHNFKTCQKKDKPAKCANCSRSKKTSSHSVTSKDCPCYIAAINQSLSRTDYGY